MQPLNHDMDDLMRDAAANYPVKPLGADWEKVAQQLGASEQESTGRSRHGVLKKFLFLLPFLLASFVCDRFFTASYGGLQKPEKTAAAILPNPKPISNDQAKHSQKTQPVFSKSSIQTPRAVVLQQPPTHTTAANPKQIKNALPQFDMGFSKSSSVAGLNKTVGLAETGLNSSAIEPLVEAIKRITIAAKPGTANDKTQYAKRKQPDRAFEKVYVSLLLGPDFSRVKTEKTKSAGYSLGVVAGYRFGKRWALESGMLWDRKNYYSSGTYFKTDHLYLPAHSEVVYVDGYCAMFELPVNVRYYLLQKGSSTVTVSAGLSSYLMQAEDYSYMYRRYNTDYTGKTEYKRASKDWFSVANLSLAYEHRMSVKNRLRIEPYVKLPVKGVGIGSLPLRSAGLLVGITHTIQ